MNIQSAIAGVDKNCIPWFCNMAENPDGDLEMMQYDHLTCLMIEIAYQKYKAGDRSHQ